MAARFFVPSILATLFGVAVTLGLGTLQIDAGLGEAFGLPSGIGLQLIIIAITAVAYMLSASTPINKGVNILSQTSMYVAFFLLVYFIVVGPTLLQLNAFTQETGVYLANLVPQSFNMAAFELGAYIVLGYSGGQGPTAPEDAVVTLPDVERFILIIQIAPTFS
jgi:glycine betaine transporter